MLQILLWNFYAMFHLWLGTLSLGTSLLCINIKYEMFNTLIYLIATYVKPSMIVYFFFL